MDLIQQISSDRAAGYANRILKGEKPNKPGGYERALIPAD
jgi:hypothetical protein